MLHHGSHAKDHLHVRVSHFTLAKKPAAQASLHRHASASGSTSRYDSDVYHCSNGTHPSHTYHTHIRVTESYQVHTHIALRLRVHGAAGKRFRIVTAQI